MIAFQERKSVLENVKDYKFLDGGKFPPNAGGLIWCTHNDKLIKEKYVATAYTNEEMDRWFDACMTFLPYHDMEKNTVVVHERLKKLVERELNHQLEWQEEGV